MTDPQQPTGSSQQPGKDQSEIRKITSPLLGVDPRSLDALMSEDVELLSDQDVDRIVAELQRQRAIWAQSEALAQAKPKRSAASKGTLNVDLGDLGL